jgi:hypothetical protein
MSEISEDRIRETIREEIARWEAKVAYKFTQSLAEGFERRLPRLMERAKERRA